jgi:hypothetical protein
METEITRPSVQHHRDAEQAAQPRLSKLQQRLTRRGKQCPEDLARVALAKGSQLARQRENGVKMGRRHQPLGTRRDPPFLS